MNNMAELNSEIVKEYGLNAGASVVGIAASKDFSLAPEGFKPSDNLDGCRSVIVLGVSFPQDALTSMSIFEYTELRNAMLTKMTDIAKIVAKRITKESGYKAKVISASGGKYVDGKHYGSISLKHAAELAGLGVITRNYLLTSPKYGNLLWFSAVLTDADLIPDEKVQYNICDNCSKCVEACPSGALNNSALFGRKECGKFFVIEDKKFVIKCFLCRRICPYRFGK
jgi:epoxyqueuosine reductase QueG